MEDESHVRVAVARAVLCARMASVSPDTCLRVRVFCVASAFSPAVSSFCNGGCGRGRGRAGAMTPPPHLAAVAAAFKSAGLAPCVTGVPVLALSCARAVGRPATAAVQVRAWRYAFRYAIVCASERAAAVQATWTDSAQAEAAAWVDSTFEHGF